MSTLEFTQIPIQFIAALGDPQSSSGEGASQWGIWRLDPGPRGVQLEEYEQVKGVFHLHLFYSPVMREVPVVIGGDNLPSPDWNRVN